MTDTPTRRERATAWIRSLTARDALKLAALIVLLAVVIPFVIFAVPQSVGADQSYVVLSGSMEPAFGPHDVIVVDSVDPASIETGDVITYGGGEGEPPTTHRVVEVEEDGGEYAFVTQGDTNDNPDGTVQAADVRGRVPTLPLPGEPLFAIPLIGHVIAFGQSTLGKVLLIGVPFGLLGLDYLREAYRSGEDDPSSAESVDGVSEQSPAELEGAVAVAQDGGSLATDDQGRTPLFTVGQRTLGLVAGLLFAGGAIAGWYGFTEQSQIIVMGAAGLITTGLLAGAFVAQSRFASSDDGGQALTAADLVQGDDDPAGLPQIDELPEEVRDWPVAELDSADALVDTAHETGAPVVSHASNGGLYVFASGIIYTITRGEPDDATADPSRERGTSAARTDDDRTAVGPESTDGAASIRDPSSTDWWADDSDGEKR